MTEKQNKLFTGAEYLFLSILGGYLIYLSSCATTFNLVYPPYMEKAFLIAFTLSGGLRLALLFLFDVEQRRRTLAVSMCALAVAIIWLMVYRNDGYYFLRLLAVLTVGFVGCDYRKALKAYAAAVGLTVLTTVFCGLGDQITNLVYSNQYRLRSSWGVIYPTDFSSVLIYLCVAIWIGWRELPDWVSLCTGALSLFVAHYVTDSNTSVYISLAFLSFVVLHMLLRHRPFQRLGKLVDAAACAVFPLSGIMMLGLLWLFSRGNGLAYRIDVWGHSRLKNALDAYRLYGIKLFGSPLTQVGNGGATVARPGYNFVDCSYFLILLRYGLVTLMVLTLLWTLMTWHAGRIGDRRLLLGLTVIALHSISEHHFTEVNYNLLLVLPFSILFRNAKDKNLLAKCVPDWDRVRSAAVALTAAVSGLSACFLIPALLSWFRTVCAVKGLDSYHYTRQRAIFVLVFACFCFLCIFLWLVYRNMLRLLRKERPLRWESLGAAFCLVSAAVGVLGITVLFRMTKHEWQAVIDGDREAVTALQSAEDCTLYVAKIPELYKSEYVGISSAFYPIEDMSRLQNVAVITDSDFDSFVLSSRGFLYAEISKDHAVYTNSASAAEALKNAGFHLTGYYAKNKKANISGFREMNGLRGWEDGGEFISLEMPLKHGPYLTLYGAAYQVNFAISHYSETREDREYWDSIDPETQVCTLRISRNAGSYIVTEQTLRRGQFDGDEILNAVVPASIPTALDVEFLAFPSIERTQFIVHSIHYQKTPSYDTHMVYDESWHKVHESYYKLDGTPLMLSGGYQAVDFGYDSDDNTNYYRYYDADGSAVLNSSGYAELRRVYNDRHQIVSESFYDTDSRPKLNNSGYASVENTFNQTGDVIVYRYYGTDGNLIMLPGGYAQLVRDYNAGHQVIFEGYYDTSENPVLSSSGYSSVSYERDAAGNVLLYRYYGTDGKPIMLSGGYAQLAREYDDKNQIIREAFYNGDGELILSGGGYAAVEYERDNAGNVLLYRYYGVNNEPVKLPEGYAQMQRAYNSMKQVIREAYLDADGDPVLRSGGYAAVEYERDAAGNVLLYRYLGLDDVPVTLSDGYSQLRRAYNSANQIIREAYENAEGEPVLRTNGGYAAVEYERDRLGNALVSRYYGLDGNPMLLSGGYAELHRVYNDRNRYVHESYYGLDGNPVMQSGGYAAIDYDWDDAGNITVYRYLDLNGEPVQLSGGYAELRREYNVMRQVIRESYFDTEGKPAVLPGGYTAFLNEYTRESKLSLTSFVDPDGNVLEMGSANLHKFLQSLYNRDVTVFISAKDEASNSFTVTLSEDLHRLGIRTDLPGKFHYSFYAVVSQDNVAEELRSDASVSAQGSFGNHTYSISSAGLHTGNYSSIIIDDVEYSKNVRGLNIVVFDNETDTVMDSVGFDTYTRAMTVTR